MSHAFVNQRLQRGKSCGKQLLNKHPVLIYKDKNTGVLRIYVYK